MALFPLGLFADVEHLHVVAALAQWWGGRGAHAPRRSLLFAPAGHTAGEVAGDVPDPDRGRQASSVHGVSVVATDEHHLVVAVGDPRELRTESGAHRRIANRAGDVGVVVLQVGADIN